MIETTEPLSFPSDRPLRRRFFTKASYSHPAKMHGRLLMWLVEAYTAPGNTIIDPMCGIGTTLLAALSQRDVVGYEIEPAFLAEAHRNAARIVEAAGMFAGRITVAAQDAREPWPHRADVVLFSPPYACRASSNHTSRHYVSHKVYKLAKAQRISYTDRWHTFVNNPTGGSAGAMTFFYGSHPAQLGHLRGDRYWSEMERIYAQALAALRPGGRMIVIIKDHIKGGQRVRVADDTARRCEALGFVLSTRLARRVWPLSLWQRRRKERGEPIVEDEDILIFGGDRCLTPPPTGPPCPPATSTAPTPRSKGRHETLCGTVMTDPPLGPDVHAPYTQLCAGCRVGTVMGATIGIERMVETTIRYRRVVDSEGE